MKKFLLAGVLALFGFAAVYAQNLPSIRIVNNTGFTIYYIYISPSGDDEWGEDILGDELLENGKTLTYQLSQPLNKVSVYDIGMMDEDDDTSFKWQVKLTNNARIEFTLDDMNAEPPEG